ncbi:unnamed protein product [Dovyalis caffra]|uniref:DSP-PTPase phosphatase fused to NAD+ Kinase domain-containing protein n=1 Tax=Dovyalis caffra TaxID=77055 RepID=A0AAV1S6I1_9ROSI|nr:unnamed protein product [Dovyalis caffra]
MVLGLFHVSVIMNRLSPVTGILTSCPCSFKLNNRDSKLFGFGFGLQRKERLKRKLKFVVSAELSKSFSVNLGLDSKKIGQSHDLSQLSWIGPVPGDIAELEAYCRIFRAAERLYAALMDTLCNPLTGECKISYDFPSEEKPLFEDKIVSVLGCIVSLLNKGREDVLTGRSSIMSSFQGAEVSVMEDKLPPLAIFRSEMKRCCESLHVALQNFLTPDDDRSLDVWRKLQRLKNVCYDSGFPRRDDYPCHMLFANWNAVYLSTSKEDLASKNSEVVFWSGGQVTEEGLNCLLERGFKTIVDLREEIIKDKLYEAAVDDAIAAGKVELIKIPVEVGTAPSMEQIAEKAHLSPQQGRSAENFCYGLQMEAVYDSHISDYHSERYGTTRCKQKGRKAGTFHHWRGSLPEQENGSLPEALDKYHGSNGMSNEAVSPKDENGQSINGAYKFNASVQGSSPLEMVDNEVGSLANISMITDPLKAQVPPCNFFSKEEMSRFFRTKKIIPPTYSKDQLNVSRTTSVRTVQKVDGTDPESVFLEAKRSNGSVNGENASPKPQSSPVITGNNVSTTVVESLSDHLARRSMKDDNKNNSVASLASGDDDLCTIEGNMCASATGVVRVQSRRKAEMFLVRTDGFSCTREQVTESSLAFTHPSTQQQMLMWKSSPKTVLLLKKLGPELMEEAKEVLMQNILN